MARDITLTIPETLWNAIKDHADSPEQGLVDLAETGLAVNSVGEGQGVIRVRKPTDEWTWNLVESRAPHEPNAPELYKCGVGRSAAEAAGLHAE